MFDEARIALRIERRLAKATSQAASQWGYADLLTFTPVPGAGAGGADGAAAAVTPSSES
jgi:hypothetical protein